MVQTVYIYNQSDIETIQPMSVSTEAINRKVRSLRQLLSAPRIYRKELKAGRRMAQAINAHPTLSNIGLALLLIAFFAEIIMKG